MAAPRKAPSVRRLHMEDKQRIIDLLRLGRSPRRVARESGHSRVTVTKYGREAGILHRPTGWKSETEVAEDASRSSKSCCEPHRAFIEAEFAKGRHGVSIYQALVEHHGYTDSYDAVKRFLRPMRATPQKISMRFETLPGKDYVEYRVMLSPVLAPHRLLAKSAI
jgi:hypothetical protein